MYWNHTALNADAIFDLWLIETWDVLKWDLRIYINSLLDRLIETWDVLKLSPDC